MLLGSSNDRSNGRVRGPDWILLFHQIRQGFATEPQKIGLSLSSIVMTATPRDSGGQPLPVVRTSASAIVNPRFTCELRVMVAATRFKEETSSNCHTARGLIARRLRRSQIGRWLSASVGERNWSSGGRSALRGRALCCDTITERRRCEHAVADVLRRELPSSSPTLYTSAGKTSAEPPVSAVATGWPRRFLRTGRRSTLSRTSCRSAPTQKLGNRHDGGLCHR